MSPRVDSATILPVQKLRKCDPLSRMIAEALDDLLLDYARSQASFTITGLRDLLLQQPEFKELDQKMLRYRVRDRLVTLETHDLVEQVGIQGKRRKIFRLQIDDMPACPSTTDGSSMPNAEATKPAPARPDTSGLSQSHSYSSSHSPDSASDSPPDWPTTAGNDLRAHLEQDRHTLRIQMETAMGESEHLRQLLTQFPQASDLINPLLEAAIAQGSQLKGKLDANIKLRRTLINEACEEGTA